MAKFFEMGGYAIYLWPAYALTLLVLGLNIAWARRTLRQAQEQARRRLIRARSMERGGAGRGA